MKTIKDYISEFNNTLCFSIHDAIRISIAEFNPPSDYELLNYANIYHYGINENKNLLLAYEFYAYAHHKNDDVQFAKPVTPVSIMQYIELAREIEGGPDESIKKFGFEEAGEYYMWEQDLLKIAIKCKFRWVIPYILEDIVHENKINQEDGLETYQIPEIYNRQLSNIFKDWDYLYKVLKNGNVN
jgi:hypothetical protein